MRIYSGHCIVGLLCALLSTTVAAALTTPQRNDRPPLADSAKSAQITITGRTGARRRADGWQVIKRGVGSQGTLPDNGGRIYDGVVAPGNSPGCIDDEGSVTLSGTSRLLIEIGAATPCTGYDRFGVGGTLNLQGGTLEVLLINGYSPAIGDVFDVLDWGSLSGTFGDVDVSQATLGEGRRWDISRLYTDGELVVAVTAEGIQVPMPAWSLVALAALLPWCSRRLGTK